MLEKHPTLIPGRQRLSVFIGLVLLSLVLAQFIELPTRTVAVAAFGSPLGFELSTEWVMAILLAGLVCTGTDALVRTHPRVREVSLRHTFIYWILPGLLAAAVARLLALAPTPALWAAGLAATGLGLVMVLVAEYTTVDPLAPGYAQARLLLDAVAYALAFALFAIIYQTRIRSLITSSATLGVSFALALDLLWHAPARPTHKAMLAGAIGLVLGESSWALNYWQLSAWSGGILLLLIFYVMTGIAVQNLRGRLKPHVLIEFLIVAFVGIAILIVFHP